MHWLKIVWYLSIQTGDDSKSRQGVLGINGNIVCNINNGVEIDFAQFKGNISIAHSWKLHNWPHMSFVTMITCPQYSCIEKSFIRAPRNQELKSNSKSTNEYSFINATIMEEGELMNPSTDFTIFHH